MDGRTQHELQRIQARLPQYLIDNLMMDDPTDLAYDELNEELLKSRHIDERAKRAIKGAASTQKRDQVVNPKVAAQIDAWFDIEIKRAIQDGRLPPTDGDLFMRERARKMREHGRT